MIEFKGVCGHTIRAKDEDAGKVVRCAYCGREASVLAEAGGQLYTLLNEVERQGQPEFEQSPWWRKRHRPGPPPPLAAGGLTEARRGFDVFGVALKMCYAAAILTVLIVAGRMGYRQWVDPTRSQPPVLGEGSGSPQPSPPGPLAGPGGLVASTSEASPGAASSWPPSPTAAGSLEPMGRGLLRPRLPPNQSGTFLNSIPPGATAYVRLLRDASEASTLKDGRVRAKTPAGRPINLSSGRYQLAVAMPLTDPGLMRLPGYADARRKLEDSSLKENERVSVLEAYFLPDRAKRIALETLNDYTQVIVRYYELEIVAAAWTPETAFFLPGDLELSELLAYFPPEKAFGFDVEAVRMELDFRQVPPEDQSFLLDALSRVGMIPYRTAPANVTGGVPSYRLFFLSLTDGTISTLVLR